MQKEWTDDIVRHYAETYGEHPSHPIVIALAAARSDDVVIDVGCGTGSVLRLLAEQVTSGTLLGVDPSEEMVRIAQEQSSGHAAGSRLSFVCEGANHLPVADASITLFLSVHSFHHWDDVGEGLDELRRVLAPGGRLLIAFEENYGASSADLVSDMLGDMGFTERVTGVHAVGEDEDLQVVQAVWPGRG